MESNPLVANSDIQSIELCGYVTQSVYRSMLKSMKTLRGILFSKVEWTIEDEFRCFEAGHRALVEYLRPTYPNGLCPRPYHNIGHIFNCMYELDHIPRSVFDPSNKNHEVAKSCIRLALFWHDMYYTSAAQDNEIQSAEEARKVLHSDKLLDACSIGEEIYDLIRVTDHKPRMNMSLPQKTIRDIDLCGLALAYDTFQQSARAIRKEFGNIDDKTYLEGRIKFIAGLLRRDQIYYTPYFYETKEQKARSNLERHLETLKQGISA